MINECRERVRITITIFCLIGYDSFLITQCRLQYVIRDTKVIVKKKSSMHGTANALAPKHPTPLSSPYIHRRSKLVVEHHERKFLEIFFIKKISFKR